MYTSTEDARSDLMLAGAVFVFGPLVVGVLLELIPLHTVPGVLPVLAILLPLATTVLVPFLLIRYRREPWSMYGLGSFSAPTFTLGVLLGLPLTVAMVLVGLIAAGAPTATVPLVHALSGEGVLRLLARLAHWLGYALIAVYGTVKARDAFRGYAEELPARAWALARIIGIAVAITAGLLLLTLSAQGMTEGALEAVAQILLPPLGVGVAVVVVLRQLPGRSTTTKATLLTPVVLMILAVATVVFNAQALVRSAYFAAIFALFGLVVGVLQEWRHSAWGAIGLGLVIATTTTFSQALMLG